MPSLNWNCLAALLFVASYAALVPGLVLPLVRVESISGVQRSQSTLEVISDTLRWGYYQEGCMIMFFTVILPIIKMVILLRRACLGSIMLRRMSKYQCVDVYVLAITLSLSSSVLSVTPQLGAWCFSMFSLLSLMGTQIISHGASAA
ncbi:unnamed protein product [Prorocentrum cordatum]|uniref:Paraquat-inducible protein A n=1 Tax=Prorocentrum cordatum TaxID=2364126 RepID=A0ABN9PRC9_9DINO|nr:unnamed protein product [Polarella glacialis]